MIFSARRRSAGSAPLPSSVSPPFPVSQVFGTASNQVILGVWCRITSIHQAGLFLELVASLQDPDRRDSIFVTLRLT
ncbi:hypothetical protein [Paraglaciecola chathamensis]|uniref:hypothetical protein n=1 Tax=Paraglaciecola chathamensis TaxID=368405 RepID=UPI00129A96E6|nr:hypothetical protein [Paraglaciecola agarilytica]